MSRGLGRLQRGIVDLLTGKLRGKVYANLRDGLDTRELAEELQAHGLLSDAAPHKQVMGATLRACRSLVTRGLVSGVWVTNGDYHWCKTVTWRAVETGKEAAPGREPVA